MKLHSPKRVAILAIVEVTFLLMAHHFLARWMADQQVVATLLSAGGHVPFATLALAAFFVMVRFVALCILPGLMGVRLVQLAFAAWMAGRAEAAVPIAPAAPHANSPQTPSPAP